MRMSDIDLPPQPQLRPPRVQTFRTISALIMREMQTTYGRSPGGYLWAVLEPVLRSLH